MALSNVPSRFETDFFVSYHQQQGSPDISGFGEDQFEADDVNSLSVFSIVFGQKWEQTHIVKVALLKERGVEAIDSLFT